MAGVRGTGLSGPWPDPVKVRARCCGSLMTPWAVWGGTRDQSPDQPEQWQVLMVSRVACGEAIFRRHPVSGLDLLYS